MTEIIARPAAGARPTHAQRKATKAAVTQQAPAQSERDTLALQVAEILQTMFMAAAYNDNDGPRELHNSHLNAVDHLLDLLLAPECHDRASEDPAFGETREHLALIASELEFAAVLMEERELSGVPLPAQTAYGAIVRHAAEYADRLFMAYCADSLDDLRHLTSFAGMRPFRDRPQPPIRRVEQEDEVANELNREQLASVLEHVATSANLLNDLLTRVPQIEGVPSEVQSLVSMAQFMIRQIGAAADQATGSWIVGGLNEWNCGSDFAQLGKAGAA
ncbi:hypothetical protein G7048_15500 [Diaphorobacter sp. HDW4B]|uniref:hypothetical protein n=1 Tax=Diaphorobacter sp. HDW4B TaxID=2714925 RepID=UPI00140D457B|nr:hypothetical protein [Diaphorobacter sp. HDW4B]QIL71634.1 hypothetical protein G7048_15500 [Diaphorobacter sp. HDW4B]